MIIFSCTLTKKDVKYVKDKYSFIEIEKNFINVAMKTIYDVFNCFLLIHFQLKYLCYTSIAVSFPFSDPKLGEDFLFEYNTVDIN